MEEASITERLNLTWITAAFDLTSQLTFVYSIETVEKSVKYVQSQQ